MRVPAPLPPSAHRYQSLSPPPSPSVHRPPSPLTTALTALNLISEYYPQLFSLNFNS